MSASATITKGLKSLCPNCGQSSVYEGFLTFKSSCDVCDADFTKADVGDGASFFVMFGVLAAIVPFALIIEIIFRPPAFVHLLLWIPATIGLSVLGLRPIKSLLFTLQWANNAEEARLDD